MSDIIDYKVIRNNIYNDDYNVNNLKSLEDNEMKEKSEEEKQNLFLNKNNKQFCVTHKYTELPISLDFPKNNYIILDYITKYEDFRYVASANRPLVLIRLIKNSKPLITYSFNNIPARFPEKIISINGRIVDIEICYKTPFLEPLYIGFHIITTINKIDS